MKSNTIIINGDKYLVEIVDSDIVSTKEYIVFRNTDVINDMSIDTDIYLVSKDEISLSEAISSSIVNIEDIKKLNIKIIKEEL